MGKKVDKRQKNEYSDNSKENDDGHTKEINEVCNESPEIYTPQNTLNQPKKARKSKRKTNSCNICNEMFRTKDMLEKHIFSAHADHRPYQCTICSRTYKRLQYLKFHEKLIHVELYNYKCDICPKSYKLEKYLKQHKKQHSNLDEFRCTLCLKIFGYKRDLERHKLTHLKGQSNSCNICTKTFKTSDTLRKHRMREHHVRIIVEQKPEKKFTCATCEKKFTTKNGLKVHVVSVHMKLKTYKCSVCLSSFARREILIRHKIREKHGHLDPKTVFECDECHAVFALKCFLQRHRKTHLKVSGESHQCEICKESVEGDRKKVVNHMKLEHSEFCYTCAVCNKTYIRRRHLTNHIKRTH